MMAKLISDFSLNDLDLNDDEKREIAVEYLRAGRQQEQFSVITEALSSGELQSIADLLAGQRIVAYGYVEAE
jgi:hypothetical protein